MATLTDYVKQAVELHRKKDFDGAMKIYNEVLAHKIFDPYLCHAVGTLYLDIGLRGVAIQMLTRCVETSPEGAPWMAESYMNLGVALRQELHDEEAMACYRRALELNPRDAVGWSNYSGCYVNSGYPEKCIQAADNSLKLDPEMAQAKHHRALALLEMGKYEAGFRAYEARMGIPEFHNRSYEGKRWYGEKTGTLVVHGEQGLGDEIMFMSLMDKVKKKADRVVVECNERLIPLLERSLEVRCYPSEEEIKKFEKTDAWVPMGSLPYVFNLKSPLEHSGYLKTDPELDKKYPKEGFRVGVSWRGGTKKTHANRRNFSKKIWQELVRPDWVSLQYGNVKSDIEKLAIVDTGWAGDMDEFASLVKSCDLVVTVCNTTVHFAGALNVPTVVLVPFAAAWRYGLKGERMLWYPSVKMIRQGEEESWESVIKRVKEEVDGRIPG